MDGLLGVTDAVLTWLSSLDSWVIYLCTGLFIALETTALVGLVIPGDAVILLAGSTVTGPAAFAAVVLSVTGGAMLGESG
jgi:membrane-associated protein